MMLIMVTSPIESFFMRSLDLLAASKSGLAANWLPDCIHNGKLTCQRTIQPGSRLKLVLIKRCAARVWAEGSMKTCAAAGSIEALDHACGTTWYSAQKVQYRQLMEPRNCRGESTSLWVWPER